MSKSRKKIILLAVIYIAVVAVSIFGLYSKSLDSWQEKIIDRFYTTRSPEQNIVIIAVDSDSIHSVGAWPWSRTVFAHVFDHVSSAKAVGVDVSWSEPSSLGSADDTTLSNTLKNIGAQTPITLPVQLLARDKVGDTALPIFTQYTKQGFVNVGLDSDGIARKISTNLQGFSSLSASLVPDQHVPLEFRLDYRGPRGTFLTIPVIDVLNNKVPARIFDNAYVFVGVTADDLHDTIETPFGLIPGVEVHATALETILDGTFRTPVSFPVAILSMVIIDLLALMCIVRIKRFSMLMPVLGILFAGITVLSAVLFSYKIIFPDLYVSVSFVLVSISFIMYQFLSESKEKRFIQKTFQYYLMPEIVSELIEHPEKLTLGGERKKVTTLFSDIKGFTTMSESLSPEQLTHFMNEYLTAMTEIIMKHGGLVDKYIGDSIMAFWGAPLADDQQAFHACSAAHEMTERLRELNIGWKERHMPELFARVGINTGEVTVGNMGSQKRFNYTIMGDEVNFASRLEGINNAYSTVCIVSESTYQEAILNSNFTFRELDIVRVKGKKEPKKIFELMTYPIDDTVQKQLSFFETGRQFYLRGEWNKAEENLTSALSYGKDGPSQVFLDRVRMLKQTNPTDWDGIYDFQTK